ncbi:MAG: hypothetical protein ACOYLQ_09180 [Hyphomicrobiaceae bacterium]
MAKLDRKLDAVAEAIGRHALEPEHVAVLRDRIARIGAAKADGSRLAVASRDLEIVARQLAELARRSEGRPIDPTLIEGLAPSVRTRVETRLSNATRRLAANARRNGPAAQGDAPDAAFRCVHDLDDCLARAKTASAKVWCNIAMVVCLVRTVLPVIVKPGASTGR